MKISTTANSALMESGRRQATILFADLSGFQDMSGKFGPQNAADAMKDCLRLLGEIAERNGGRLDRVTEGCVAALFGAPKAIEDSPRRAIESALEMRDCVRDIRKAKFPGEEIHIRIGMDSGEVFSGEVDSDRGKEFTVSGTAVNNASSLKDIAPKGRILVGAQTWRQTRDFFEYKDLDPLPFKGKANPGSIHELLAKKTKKGGDRMVFSALVGRARELEVLERQVVKVITGEGSIVNLVGEAGLGKSRLIAELKCKYAMERVILLEGRAQSFGKNLPYYPIIDLLKKWAGIREEDDEVEALAKLESAIHYVNPEETAEVLPFIATMMGIKLGEALASRMDGIVGETLTRLIFKYSRDILAKGAESNPIVIILEDLHLADQSTLDFLSYLFKAVEKSRVLFINVFRPSEERCEKFAFGAREEYPGKYAEIRLRPLEIDECFDLVENLLKTEEMPPRIVESLASRSGGNPFFIEEIVRNWIDEKAIELGKAGFRAVGTIDSLPVPATVREAIMARFDRLDEDTRSLLKAASVIGPGFFRKILTGIIGDGQGFDRKIALLKEMQMIIERSRLDETEYRFKHALVQETIYDSILYETRKNLHICTAETIESIFHDKLDEMAGMLAWHYAQGENIEKAEKYLILSGEAALKAAASNEAIEYFREALELSSIGWGESADREKIAKLETNIAKSLFYKGRWAEAIPYYDKAIAFYGIVLPKSRPAEFLAAFIGFLKCRRWLRKPEIGKARPLSPEHRAAGLLYVEKLTMMGMMDSLRVLTQTFILVGRFLDYDIIRSEPGFIMLAGISWIFSWSGISFSLSGKVLAKIKALVHKDLPQAWIYYLVANGLYCLNSGNWTEIGDCLDPSLDKIAEQGRLIEVLSLMLFACCAFLERGLWDKYAEAYVALKRIKDRFDTDFGSNCLYLLDLRYRLKTRRIEESRRELPGILRFFSKAGLGEDRMAISLSYSARFAVLDGDSAAAADFLDRQREENYPPIANVFDRGLSLMGKASYAVERVKDAAESKRLDRRIRGSCLSDIMAYLKNAKSFAPDITEAMKFLGSYWWHLERPKKALKYWRLSIGKGESLGAKVELSHTYVEAGALLGTLAPGPEWAGKGAEIAKELGILPYSAP